MNGGVTYKTAGVDIDAGAESLRRIKEFAKSTHNEMTLAGLGTFGSLFDLSGIIKEYREPVLVQSADGVGTKLMVANMTGEYGTVGIDLVNHCCNDILCQGAKGVTFLDYIAADKLKPAMIADLVGGMAKACVENGVALVGGETAELPGTYAAGEYDLVGVITGVVEKSRMIDGSKIAEGDALLGLFSNGLHTNGYTLARKVFFDRMKMKVDDVPADLGESVGSALLAPHKNYAKTLWPLLQTHRVKGLAHITGGGLIDNVPRILPPTLDARIELSSWEVPPLFQMIQRGGDVPADDMFRTFNMGVGMVIAIDEEAAGSFAAALEAAGEKAIELGRIVAGTGKTKLI